MHRIDSSTRSQNLFGTGKDGFTNGQPGVTPPTNMNAAWCNSLQEEIATAIEENGGTLSGSDNGQLSDALHHIHGRAGEAGISVVGGAGDTDGVYAEASGAGAGLSAATSGAGPAVGGWTSGTGPAIVGDSSYGAGVALKLVPNGTLAAERVGTQSAPSGASVVGDRYVDAGGAVRSCRVAGTPGTFRAIGAPGSRQQFTSGSGTYNTPAGCVAILVRCWGGGGAGGGTPAVDTGKGAAGSGGGSGGYCERLIVSPSGSYSYSVGVGGAGNIGGDGLDGDDTTFDSMVAIKGRGGKHSINSNDYMLVPSKWPNQSYGGQINGSGQMGEWGFCAWEREDGLSTYHGGGGGQAPVGRAGPPTEATVNTGGGFTGSGASDFAAGGGGAASYNNQSALAGGAGAPGKIDVLEFY